MMEKLLRRGGDLADAARQRAVRRVAQQLRTLFGTAQVEVEEARVLAGGRRMMKRWLTDPAVRFFGGGVK